MIPLSERLQEKIKPCPFCGQKPVAEACDRLVVIGCKECGYTRSFPGIVQSDHETDVVASYSKNSGEPIEWYDMDAEDKAVKRWNIRYNDTAPICKAAQEPYRIPYVMKPIMKPDYRDGWCHDQPALGWMMTDEEVEWN